MSNPQYPCNLSTVMGASVSKRNEVHFLQEVSDRSCTVVLTKVKPVTLLPLVQGRIACIPEGENDSRSHAQRRLRDHYKKSKTKLLTSSLNSKLMKSQIFRRRLFREYLLVHTFHSICWTATSVSPAQPELGRCHFW